MEGRKAACTEGEVVVGEIKDEAVGVEETKSSSLGFDLNTQKSNNSASTAVSSQPVLRLTSGVSPYHIQTSGSKSLHRPQRESRGKDRLSVGAFTISRSHAVSRGARVGSTAAEIIATLVCIKWVRVREILCE